MDMDIGTLGNVARRLGMHGKINEPKSSFLGGF
jgi:hypothetical protein